MCYRADEMSVVDDLGSEGAGEIPPEWAIAVMNTPQRFGFLPTLEFWHGSGQAHRFLFRGRRLFLTMAQVVAIAVPIALVSGIIQQLLFQGAYSWLFSVLNMYAVTTIHGSLIEGAARRGLAKKCPQLALEAKASKSLPE